MRISQESELSDLIILNCLFSKKLKIEKSRVDRNQVILLAREPQQGTVHLRATLA